MITQPDTLTHKKVLIVEDEQSLLRALKDAFTYQGFEVIGANNGKSGLRLALQKHPDIILLDIVLPKMDGVTVLKLLREDGRWGKSVPIIMLTNLHGNERAIEALTHGSFEYLIKSEHTIGDIIKRVKTHLV